MSDDDDDGPVGYGRPPKRHQFQPGRSGNPKGRPKGSRGLRTDLKTELEGRMEIRINGQPVRGTRQQLFLRALTSRAAAGDLRAAAILAPLVIQVLGIEDRNLGPRQLSAEDQLLLDQILTTMGLCSLPEGDNAEPAASLPADKT